MSLNTYLTFSDNCREAFDQYRAVFGGEFSELQTFADGPPDMGILDDAKNLIMHVSLPIGDSVLMGSDSSPGFGPDLVVGNNFAISFAAASRADADEKFNALSADGEVGMPMQDMFWGDYFGSCTDRFGVAWQIIWQPPQDD